MQQIYFFMDRTMSAFARARGIGAGGVANTTSRTVPDMISCAPYKRALIIRFTADRRSSWEHLTVSVGHDNAIYCILQTPTQKYESPSFAIDGSLMPLMVVMSNMS